MNIHKTIATGLGIGLIGKGSGTVAAAACCIAWYLLFAGGSDHVITALATLAITAVGVWSSNEVEKFWGVDSSRVVIDEIAGMCISLLFMPVTLGVVITAFVLFRFFDIAKPIYIRKAETLPGGWGVMADDVLAGLYTNIVVQVAIGLSIL